MFYRILNIPLDYLSWFSTVLREIHGNFEMCLTKYSIPSKLIRKMFPLFWNHTWNYNKVNERLTKVIKEKWQLFNLKFLLLHFLHSNVPVNKCHKQKWCVLFFTRIKLVAPVPACAHLIARIKWIRLQYPPTYHGFSRLLCYMMTLGRSKAAEQN